MDKAQDYVDRIMADEIEDVVSETPTVFDHDRVERIYEFADGAIVKYEWQDASLGGFNHRFTLVEPPNPNPEKLKGGVITTINYRLT